MRKLHRWRFLRNKKGKGIGNIRVAENRPFADGSAVKFFENSSAPEIIECDNALCPLSRIKAGTAVRIKQLSTSPGMSQRLREIGFCEEQIIRLVRSQANFICQVCNARFAISEELARMILVEPVLQRVG